MNTIPSPTDLQLESPLKAGFIKATRTVPSQVQWRGYTIALLMNDFLAISLAFWLSYEIRFELSLGIFYQNLRINLAYYQGLVILLLPAWLFIFYLLGLYDRQYLLGGTQEYSRVFNGSTIGILLVIATGFLLPDLVFARGWLLLAWIFAFLFSASGRFVLRRVVYAMRRKGYFLSPAVIIGANKEGISLAEQLTMWKTSGFNILGFIDKKLPIGTLLTNNLPVLGTVEQLDELIQRFEIEEIILASSAISSRDKMLDIFQRYGVSGNVNMHMSSGLYEIITTGLTVKEFAYVPLVGVNKVRLNGFDQFIKFILDYTIAIPAVTLLLPIMAGIALAVKIDSPGPVIYRRRVLGINGRQFDAYKFRTMHVNGEEILQKYPELQAELRRNFKLRDDPRVTRVGKSIRKWSLDELPQIFNVLKREMSLVGPRIITPEEVEKYKQWDINLMTVRPGITGLWQVSGRSDVTYEERVRLDMHYIRNYSIWLDLQLLLRTVPAVFRRRGAY